MGKVISMSGYLQMGLHKMSDQLSVPDHITQEGQTYKDSFDHGTERWTLAGILQNSSNVGMIMAGENYPDEQRYEYLTKFGIGQPTGLNLPGESSGLLTNFGVGSAYAQHHPVWSGLHRQRPAAQQRGGHHREQGCQAAAVDHQINTDANGKTTETKKGEATRVVDEKVASDMMNAMESVAEGYNKFVKVDGYRMAAKSGTAEVQGSDGTLSSIISDYSVVIPADNPRYAVTVVMKDPNGVFGGLTAGPVSAQICEFLMQKYEVPVSSPRKNAIPVTW